MLVLGHPMSHGFQIITSMAHLYGVMIYYAKALFTGTAYSRPEPLYFWIYFIGFNAPWLFVPILLIWSSLKQIAQTARVDAGSKRKTT
jgi:cholestenol delta-isomerase